MNGFHAQFDGASNLSMPSGAATSTDSQAQSKPTMNGTDLNHVNGALAENTAPSLVRTSLTKEQASSKQALPSRANGLQNGQPKLLQRAKTAQHFAPDFTAEEDTGTEQNWELRHGWEEQYNSEEYLHLLSSV